MAARPDSAPVYCDRLTGAVAAEVLRLHATAVVSLEALDGPAERAAERLRSRGVAVQEAQFFAGTLRDEDGEAVYLAARRLSGVLALKAAAVMVGREPELSRSNARYGRDTVRLYLAKTIVLPIERALVRLFAARALAGGAVRCLLAAPDEFDVALLEGAVRGVEVCAMPGPGGAGRTIARTLAVAAARSVRGALGPRKSDPTGAPAVLLVREGDVGADRSYRGQPHWLEEDATPSYGTALLPRGGADSMVADAGRLARSGVTLLGRGDAWRATRNRRPQAIYRDLRADRRACLRAALGSRDNATRRALMHVWVLLGRAAEMAAVADHVGARVFLTGEPYVIEADAMQLVAGALGVHTIAFQYSNLAFMSPLMLTTADQMVLFSPMYHTLWEAEGIAPGAFTDAGYVFDSAFSLVQARARSSREKLEQSGARFVLCHFDESVQTDRWGLIHEGEHRAELVALAQLVVDDATVGLIVKCQFEQNSPSRRYAGDPTIAAAMATGRYLELRHGSHRNVVHPAEAALAADLCIGHAIGATAVLEAALAGRRSVMINSYGLRTAFDDVYARADVVRPSLAAVLEGVRQLRADGAGGNAFGDWSPIRHHFDPFADGRASERLRALIESRLAPDVPEPRAVAAVGAS